LAKLINMQFTVEKKGTNLEKMFSLSYKSEKEKIQNYDYQKYKHKM
jgi:hypothetical protein